MRTVIIFATIFGLLAGCSRQHLEPAYGRSYREQFSLQRERSTSSTKVTPGLDAQEASIIASTYRASLAPKGAQHVTEEPILVVAPQQRYTPSSLPPPSVPKE
jgi:hypothetical protein